MYYLTFRCNACGIMLDKKETKGLPLLCYTCPECGSFYTELMLIYKADKLEKEK